MDQLKKGFGRVEENEYQIARRRTYLKIDLDILSRNVSILNSLCSSNTEILAVVKGNAYGHGSVEIAKHLVDIGVKHFAVASPGEGIDLRKAGIDSYIQIFGNACEEEIPDLIEYDLVPTVGSVEFLREWALYSQNLCPEYLFEENYEFHRPVVIKVDTGMSRNGFQPEQLDDVVSYCDENGVRIHSIMTHFAAAWDDQAFTTLQLESFLNVAAKYRSRGIKLHAANSAGTLLGYGNDLDFVRPGIAMYGLPPDTTAFAIDMYNRLGLRPILSWMAKPNLVKTMSEGRTVGYDNTHRCEEGEIIATISVGYADGYNRLLSGKGIITTENGAECPVIGRVSMDAISVRLPYHEDKCSNFYIFKNDFTSPNSVVELAKQLHTITYDVVTSLAARLARVYAVKGSIYLTRT
ncbi:alanine racemase-like [Mercenaria mercenaria]|uniref:alanine racemase-like n=1 Tax=Mercenaria mercenaria TaxID=6596 RepID=UPI00234E74C9|nr:alanine racemase-like [Mercenaria mercenaria]